MICSALSSPRRGENDKEEQRTVNISDVRFSGEMRSRGCRACSPRCSTTQVCVRSSRCLYLSSSMHNLLQVELCHVLVPFTLLHCSSIDAESTRSTHHADQALPTTPAAQLCPTLRMSRLSIVFRPKIAPCEDVKTLLLSNILLFMLDTMCPLTIGLCPGKLQHAFAQCVPA